MMMPKIKAAIYLIITGEILIASAIRKLQQVKASTAIAAAAIFLLTTALLLIVSETLFYAGG